MTPCTLEDSRGQRELTESEFPLEVGGANADIHLPGSPAGEPLAFVGLQDGELFVQPAGNGPVICNGAPLEASSWLQPGDVLRFGADRIRVEGAPGALRLRIDASSAGSAIQPPTRRPAPIAGGRIRPVDFQPSSIRPERRRWRPRVSALLAGLLVGLAIAAGSLLFLARSVEIEVQPEPDQLELSGGLFHPRLLGRFLLLPGAWTVRAEKQGYQSLEVPLEVGREARQRFHFELQKLPGRLAVSTPGIAGATVWVEGDSKGETPIEIELAPGEHELWFRAPRYQDTTERVLIEGLGKSQTLRVQMEPGWAEVSLQSEPPGAQVSVDGEQLGVTPMTTELSAGLRRVELRRAGFVPLRFEVEVTPGEAVQLPSVELRVAPGRLAVKTEPTGASVTVGGVFRGSSPLELTLEPTTRHQITVSRSGFESLSEEVVLGPGEARTLRLELLKSVGELRLRVWPGDAELLVNGRSLGTAPEVLTLPAVPQELELRKAGYQTVQRRVTPVPGLPQRVEISLETLEAAAERATPLLITSSEGHELRRIEGGRFQMGAPRREPGRRANEAIREVEITRRFYLATKEVQNAQFRRFREGHLSGGIGGHNLEIDHHPVVRITWEDAAAYCNWLSDRDGLPHFYQRVGGRLTAVQPPNTGYRLPTEAEWVWAARYPQGRGGRKYPWGDQLPPPPGAGNYGDASAQGLLPSAVPGYNDGYATTSPTDAFDPDERGFFDLDGNVAEWVHDLYGVTSSFGGAAERDPMGPEEGDFHVIRGSSWRHDSVTELRWSYREYGREARADLGFRIARFAD